MDILERLNYAGVIPVVVIDDAKDAVPTAEALLAGGINVMEITFRTAAAPDAIEDVADNCPDMLVGAGTVITLEQCQKAVEMGAKFIVSPGFDEEVVKWCVDNGVAITPGCVTPSEIMAAMKLGLKVVKFFPAEAMGGLATIKAMSAPYGGVKFMPTGGVNEDNLNTYLGFDKIIACGGSWMAKDALIDAGEFDKIEELARGAVRKMLGFELLHVGLNCGSEEEAEKVARQFSALFGWPVKLGNSSVFAGTAIEVMKQNGRGTKGHIAVGCNSVMRARAYLESQGFEFDESSIKMKGDKLNLIYLKDEIGGFAVHLLQK